MFYYPMPQRQKKIVILNPDQEGQTWLQRYLEKFYHLEMTSNCEDTFLALKQAPVDLLILAENLPEMSGISFSHHLSGIKEFSDIPILLISSQHTEDLLIQAFQSGIGDFITEPFHPEELKTRIAVLIRSQNEKLQNRINLRKLEEKSEHDVLTKAFNRTAMYKYGSLEIAKARRNQEPVSLMILDIDRFKKINDSYGHQAADDILAELSTRLKFCLRKYDIIARYGGDEFIVILPYTTQEHSTCVAKKILDTLTSVPFETRKGPIPLKLSIGITTFDNPKATVVSEEKQLEGLIASADQALYKAKGNGRAQFATNNL